MYGAQPFHIKAYTFRVDIWCPNCVAEWAEDELVRKGFIPRDEVTDYVLYTGLNYDAGIVAHRAEILLQRLAYLEDINLEDYYSFDSYDFPKVIFRDQIEGKEYCGKCGDEL